MLIEEFLNRSKIPVHMDMRFFLADFNTIEDAWKNCDRPHWMFWILRRIKFEDRSSVLRFMIRAVRETRLGEEDLFWDLLSDESKNAVQLVEEFAEGKLNLKEFKLKAKGFSIYPLDKRKSCVIASEAVTELVFCVEVWEEDVSSVNQSGTTLSELILKTVSFRIEESTKEFMPEIRGFAEAGRFLARLLRESIPAPV